MSKKLVITIFAISLTSCTDNKSNVEVIQLEIAKKPSVAMAPTHIQQNQSKKNSITYSKQSQSVVSERNIASDISGLSTTSIMVSTVKPKLTDNMSVSLDLSQSSNQFSEEQVEAERSTDLEIVLSKTLASKNKIAVSTLVSHNDTGFNDTVLDNTVIAYSLESQQINRDNSVVYSARAILPTNDVAREDASFQGAASMRAALTSKKQLANKPMTLVTFIDGLKYSHGFATNADGEGNMNYRIRVYGAASVDVTQKVSVGVEGYYQAGHTEQNALKAKFLLAEEVAYTPKKDGASIYMAHSNNQNALGPNGEDSNVKAFDKTTSVFSAGVRATF